MAQAGARFETYVRAAVVEAIDPPTLAELYRRSGIAASTWSGWFRGIATPRRNSLVLAGAALERTPEQLLAAWDGAPQKRHRSTETPDTLVAALTRQSDALEALVARLGEGWEARLRAVEAELALRAGPADEARPTRSAPRGTGG